MKRLFATYGLPYAIQADNGPPFGSGGPRGWSTLSTWWVKLGIKVQYSRPGRPGDNAEHEQMHRALQKETAEPPARNPQAQQRRFDRWRRRYNEVRPHESLQMKNPASVYQRSRRQLPVENKQMAYPVSYDTVRLDRRGRLFWQGRQRLIGKACPGENIGLKAITPTVAEVYLGKHLLGTLHATDTVGLRAVRWRYPTSPGREGAAPPPFTLPTY